MKNFKITMLIFLGIMIGSSSVNILPLGGKGLASIGEALAESAEKLAEEAAIKAESRIITLINEFIQKIVALLRPLTIKTDEEIVTVVSSTTKKLVDEAPKLAKGGQAAQQEIIDFGKDVVSALTDFELNPNDPDYIAVLKSWGMAAEDLVNKVDETLEFSHTSINL